MIAPNSTLVGLLTECLPLEPEGRALALENSTELESAYRVVALKGNTEAPANAEDEVNFHYVCFVKSDKNKHLYELDGDKTGPIDRGAIQDDEDMLSTRGLKLIQDFIDRENGNINFSLMALVPAD
jgi:ubiquitin carboxyl-terminal hydrolase L3